jgi:hypothetical protein
MVGHPTRSHLLSDICPLRCCWVVAEAYTQFAESRQPYSQEQHLPVGILYPSSCAAALRENAD